MTAVHTLGILSTIKTLEWLGVVELLTGSVAHGDGINFDLFSLVWDWVWPGKPKRQDDKQKTIPILYLLLGKQVEVLLVCSRMCKRGMTVWVFAIASQFRSMCVCVCIDFVCVSSSLKPEGKWLACHDGTVQSQRCLSGLSRGRRRSGFTQKKSQGNVEKNCSHISHPTVWRWG